MAKLSNVLGGTNPLTQMIEVNSAGRAISMGDPSVPNVMYNPTQRLENQMRTASQVQNYAASKNMAEQGRTDMRGNVVGYADTLG